MSLEQALVENTAAINKLIEVMQAQGTTGASVASKAKAETPKAETVRVVLSGKDQNGESKTETFEVAKAETSAALVYADIRKPFLALVESDEKAALGILSDLGIKSLKAIEDKPDQFADALARVQKAQEERA